MKYVIGVDIGGTNTDAVLVDQNERIVASVKTTTTKEIDQGFFGALEELLSQAGISPNQVSGIFLGTTHATNAILQCKSLYRVGIIRIAGQQPDLFPSGYAWPSELKKAVVGASITMDGGFECHGGVITPFNLQQAQQAIESLLAESVESIAVVGVFSPLNSQQESQVADLIRTIAGKDFPISLSQEIGGIGFIERENSTILNAALKKVMEQGFRNLTKACQQLEFLCPLMITQNDGSLIEIEKAIQYPVLTISAGPTNSFIGASHLAGLANAVVVDIGGTSTDVGLVRNGFPVRSLNTSNIGGVSLNFPMPNVLSIGLGGGSLVECTQDIVTIGPQSVAKELLQKAQSFGGSQLTLTDVALNKGCLKMEGTQPVSLSLRDVNAIYAQVREKIEQLVIQMQGENTDLPVILVGGGASLIPVGLFDDRYRSIPNFGVANAYGAALAEISGIVDTVVSLRERESTLEKLCKSAIEKAIQQGADPETLRLVDQQIIPYAYVPNQMARVAIRFSGKQKRKDSSIG